MNLRFSCKLLLVSTMLVLASCQDHSPVGPPIPTPEGPHLKGKVSNWLLGDTLVAVARYQRYPYSSAESIYVFGASAISKDGSFYVPLSAPSGEALYGLAGSSNTATDTAAHFVQVYALAVRNPDKSYSGKYLTNASVPTDIFFSDSSKAGDFLASFIYVDRDVQITATSELSIVTTGGVVRFHDHLSCKKGWNRIVNTVVSNQAHQIEVEATVLTTDSGNWYLE